jgi:hypothetical protein
MTAILVLLVAAALAWVTYWRLERPGPRAWVPASARAVAWAALGLLLLDLTCAVRRRPGERPMVLLDASLSMGASGAQWAEARDSARRWGEVRLFGDARPDRDSEPNFGRSDLAPALAAAAASGRQVIVVTDGEITDPLDIAGESLPQVTIRLFPRRPQPDLAVTRVAGPDRVTAGDTVRLEAEVRAVGPAPDSVRLEARADGRLLAHRAVRLGANGTAMVPLTFGTRGLAGDLFVSVGVASAKDAEPRDDARLWLVQVTPTPGIVLIANPSDWDGRYLFETLKQVAHLPLRGYTSIEPGRWRSLESLALASVSEVAQAARRANVLVIKGQARDLTRGAQARGIWLWPSGEAGGTVVPGEWYAVAPGISPVSSAFVGQPVDSFPPLIEVSPIDPPAGGWVGLGAQLARRGMVRPVLVGAELRGHRIVTTAADGLWRWAFRGGSSEQSYRAMVAGTLSWLLGGVDSLAGPAQPLRAVVPNGRPVVFVWTGRSPMSPLPISLAGEGGGRRDTLRFDGAGQAPLWLPPGRYRYALEGGGAGAIAVDQWSEEWLPKTPVLKEQAGEDVRMAGITSTRQWIALFGVLLLALAIEWVARRRLGLR